MGRTAHIEIEDLWKLRKDIRNAADRRLPKRMGQAHRNVGRFVRSLVERESDPAAVGAGRGATLRPSSSKREVLLRVGGSHRANPNIPPPDRSSNRYALATWGVRLGRRPGESAPDRPHIVGIIERHRGEIEDEFFNQVMRAMQPAFYDMDM